MAHRDDSDPGREAVELPIDGTLDLHAFAPGDLPSLLPEWLRACRERGILEVRIVHGKGTGALRRSVAALLARSPDVLWHGSGDEASGGWGATLARLRPLQPTPPSDPDPGGG